MRGNMTCMRHKGFSSVLRSLRLWWLLSTAGTLALTLPVATGEPAIPSPAISPVLTNVFEMWTLPAKARRQPHPIRTEVIVYYIDRDWNNAWGECLGRATWLPLGDSPVPFKPGQRLAIEGLILPVQERLLWDQTTIRVLEENAGVRAEPLTNWQADPVSYKSHLVQTDALVDRLSPSRGHLTLHLVHPSGSATAYVLTTSQGGPLHFREGDFVEIKGVYSPQFNLDGQMKNLELWIAQTNDIQVVGNLRSDARFNLPRTPIEEIGEASPTNTLHRVEGSVRRTESGGWVIIWDRTGQIIIRSSQTQPLRFGERIEAVGYPQVLGVQQCLRGALYRVSTATNGAAGTDLELMEGPVLRLAEQVRSLDRASAARRVPVSLRAVVTWSHVETPYAYVEDGSGGIRIANPRWATAETSKPGTIVHVEGEAAEGDFVPVVTNAVVSRVGWWPPPEARLVDLEEALTGVEDGSWVEMQGYVRKVTPMTGLQRLDLGTSSGDFQALVPFTDGFEALKGAIIRARGVCTTRTNPRHQLTGVEILVPEPRHIHVEEAAPRDLFATALRPLSSLRRFSLGNVLNRRLRTSGTVLLHRPGRYLCVQDGTESLFALSQETNAIAAGDTVEVVGFPGYQGRRFVLREAVYRRTGSGPDPTPIRLHSRQALEPDLEGLLVTAEGILLNRVKRADQDHLLIQNRDCTFEASLEGAKSGEPVLEIGTQLAVIGVHELRKDEHGRQQNFHLQLRSWKDVTVTKAASWWTPTRTAWVLLTIATVTAVALLWGSWNSHQNWRLQQAQAELRASHATLEVRVRERTRELQAEVSAKEGALSSLAEAQERLMLASRQAGMAEVATGVLHNVGNVLNSVNVSSTLIRESLKRSKVASLARLADLFRQNAHDTESFLKAKGHAIPRFIIQLADELRKEHAELEQEAESVANNVEHIKEVVAMQQGYGRISGLQQMVRSSELVDHAVDMAGLEFARRPIRIVKEYAHAPEINVDRHRVLQILVNLLTNARHALEDSSTPDPTVRLSIDVLDSRRVQITVADNGVGISTDDLTRIFAHGFTTRKDGHGFGLHSGALAAYEMGGTLRVRSDGVGHGASFALELPIDDTVDAPQPAQ